MTDELTADKNISQAVVEKLVVLLLEKQQEILDLYLDSSERCAS